MPMTLMDENDKPADEIEDGLEVEVEVNPNIEDQLESAASEDGIKGVSNETKKEPETVESDESIEAKYKAFMDAHPEARDIHGKKTAKRIDKMTWATREAERQRDEAIEFAKRTQEENSKLKKNQTNQDGAFINEHKTRLEMELDRARMDLANAHSLNDSQGVADATQKVARLGNQLDLAAQTETRFRRVLEEPVDETPAYTPPPIHRETVDPKAEAWAETNEWFGEDKEMTQAALTIHRTLVTQDGYLPQTDAYYRELDNRIRKNYPDSVHFKGSTTVATPDLKNPQSSVTPVNSNAVNRNRTGRVHLSAAQVRVAKKLGVPLTEYAKSLEAYLKDK